MRNKSKEEIKSETEPEGPVLKCPNCDNADPTDFEWCEDVTSFRKIRGFDDHGQLLVSGLGDTGDGGDNERFMCNACGAEFPVPDSICIEWE